MASKKNGELLLAMSDAGINYLITADKNLRFQQNLAKYPIILVVLLTVDTRRKYLMRFVGEIEAAITAADPLEKVIEIDIR